MAKISPLAKRRIRIRHQLKKAANGLPRLTVFRSNSNIHAQVVLGGKTVAAASTLDKELAKKLKSKSNADAAKAVGELVAKRASEQKIKEVIFDRSGYIYHGRVKALADGAREAGLKF